MPSPPPTLAATTVLDSSSSITGAAEAERDALADTEREGVTVGSSERVGETERVWVGRGLG